MEMDQQHNWDFNAPTFVDFQNDEHEKNNGVDDYFNYNHESLNSAGLAKENLVNEATFEVTDEQNNNRQTFVSNKGIIEDIKEETSDNGSKETSPSFQGDDNQESEEMVVAQEPALSEPCELETLGVENDCQNETKTEQNTADTKQNDTDPVENTAVHDDLDICPSAHAGLDNNDSVFQAPKTEGDDSIQAKENASTTELLNNIGTSSEKPQIASEVAADSLEEDENENMPEPDTKTKSVEDNQESLPVNHGSTEVEMAVESQIVEDKNEVQDNSKMDVSPVQTQYKVPLTQSVEKGNSAVLTNLITPSRLASWERSRQTRRSVATMPPSKDRRSKRLEKLKEIRKSAKFSTPTNPTGPPPSKKAKKNPAKVKLTESITPTVLKHSRHSSVPKAKSTEEMELEAIESLKYQAKQLAKESSKSFKRALKNPPVSSGTPVAKTTKVKEFKFQTDDRVKSTHTMDTRSRKLSSEIDFTKGLRQHPPSPTKLKKTVVKPFNLSSNRKRKEPPQPGPSNKGYDFVPMAKAVLNFHKGTRANNATAETRKGPMKAKLGLTVAKTPKLESRSRTRAISVMSQKQIEDQEVEEMKSYHFKAKPVNHEILEHAAELPKVKRCPSTEPIGFNLEIDKRVEERPKLDRPASPAREFRARPVPKKILEGTVDVAKPEPAKPTVPQSPAFKLKNRMYIAQIRKENKENFEKEQAMAKALAEKQELETTFKKPTITKKKPVVEKNCEIKPFSFDSRDKERFAKKEQKIKEVLESQKAMANSFRATPMLVTSDPVKALPPKHVRPKTEPKPFNMHSDERGAIRAEKWKHEVRSDMMVEEEVKALRKKAEFKANTNYSKVIYGKAFKPAIDNKKYTDTFEEFPLHTNDRAVQREEFDEHLKHKEAELLALRETQKKITEELEREEFEKARKETEHHANPVRRYKPLVIGPSAKEPTDPMSPHFSDRFYKKH